MTTRIAFPVLLLACVIATQTATAASDTTHAPVSRASDLGLVVDSTSAQQARDGLRVLAATPGSVADQLGLRPGDVLVDVNGTSLKNLGSTAAGHALAATTLKSRLDTLPDREPLRLRVVRDGVTLVMNAPPPGEGAATDLASTTHASADSDPSATGCGRISTFDVAPRGDHLYHATILLLDGTTPGPSGQQTWRVAAGEHHLLVAEDIPTLKMGIGEIATLRRNTKKTLTVTVKPDTTTLIAAQFHPDKAADLAHGTYWDPLAWRVIKRSCP